MNKLFLLTCALGFSVLIAVPAFAQAPTNCVTAHKGTCVSSASCDQGVANGTKKVQANTNCEATAGNVCCVAVSATGAKKGATETTVGYGLKNPLGNRTIQQIVGDLVSWLGGLAGMLFFFTLLWGGIEWMTARGDGKAVQQAQKRMMNAVLGIGIILLSYFIIDAVMGLPNLLITR